jgi:hypothetical protein
MTPALTLRPGRCWACGEPHLKVGDPVEHIVASAIGGVLTTDRFASDCNERLGRLIDQPFLRDPFVAIRRVRHGIKDPRRPRPPASPRLAATTSDGRSAIFDLADNTVFWPPHFTEDGDRHRVTAQNKDEARRAVESKVERLRRDGFKVQVGQPRTVRQPDDPVEAKFTLSMDSFLRARVAAKIALGAFSLVLPEEWLDTDGAKLLQSWLWDERPKTEDGGVIFAAPQEVPSPIDTLGAPPKHTLFFLPGDGRGALFGIVLFGEELMVVRTGPLDGRPPEIAWQLDPITRTCKKTSFSDLALRAAGVLPNDREQHGLLPSQEE